MKVQRTSGQGHAALLKAIKDLAHKQARVGFFENSKYEDGTPVAYVATIQEFGYAGGGIPPRPFMRPTIAEQRNAWRQTLAKGANAVMNGRLTVQMMLEQFGMMAAGDVKKTIAAVATPALKQSTLDARQRRKKTPGVSNKPLVDTGFLISQVSSDVVDK